MVFAHVLPALAPSTAAVPGEVKAGGPEPGGGARASRVGYAVPGPAPKPCGPPSASCKTGPQRPGAGKSKLKHQWNRNGGTALRRLAQVQQQLPPLQKQLEQNRDLLAALALLSGCAVGPDFHRPAPPTVSGYTREALSPQTAAAEVPGGEAQRFRQNQDIVGPWWTLFQSPALNAVVEQALAANPTIVSARAALRQARELVDAQRGFFYPTVQGSFTGTRQHTSGTISPVLNSPSTDFNLYTAQVTVGYSLDVWGGNRRQVESLQAQADAQHFLLQATYVTLTANVVAAAVQEASLRGSRRCSSSCRRCRSSSSRTGTSWPPWPDGSRATISTSASNSPRSACRKSCR